MESIRDLLTQAIAENPYWNSRKYHALVSKEMDCTYQGVHKVIRQLVEEGVLEDRNRTFSLSRKWLLRNIDFSKGALTKLEDNPQNFFEYPDYIEFTHEFIKILDKIPETGPCYAYWKHAWPPHGLIGDSYERLKRIIATCLPVFACEGDTPGDRSVMKIYEDAGCRALIGFRLPGQRFDWVAHVESGFFSQIMFPEEFYSSLRKIYQKGDAGSNTAEIVSLLHKPAKITVIITYNRELALKYREKVLAKRGRKGK